jgi:hypothetical protein
MKFVLGGVRSAPPKTNFIAGLSNAWGIHDQATVLENEIMQM